MNRQFVACSDYRTARKRCPWASKVAKVEGGYLCFRYVIDYEQFKKERLVKRTIEVTLEVHNDSCDEETVEYVRDIIFRDIYTTPFRHERFGRYTLLEVKTKGETMPDINQIYTSEFCSAYERVIDIIQEERQKCQHLLFKENNQLTLDEFRELTSFIVVSEQIIYNIRELIKISKNSSYGKVSNT